MHTIQEVLRLRYDAGLSHQQIARVCQISKGVVSKYLSLAQAQQLSWPLPPELDEVALAALLMPPRVLPSQFVEPNHAEIHVELKRKGVTLQLLWSEYATNHGKQAYRYSQFCQHYRDWRGRQKRSMRQVHLAGEKLFIDYCGPTVPIIDRTSGEVRCAQVFVSVLGASSYTFAEATWSQGLPDWIASHQRAFTFYGGVPALLVPDNLKSATTQASRYDPQVNSTYREMARHYGTAVLPARPYKPKDKSKAELGVQVVERWILARLRHHTFFSLAELNRHIHDLLVVLNAKPFQKLAGSRRSQFEALDLPALRSLPASAYSYADWKRVKVNIDYHVGYDNHYYSVPHRYVGALLDVRATANTVECLLNGQRLTSHPRARGGGYSTHDEHMPAAHRAHKDWSPSRFLCWADSIGVSTHAVVQWLLTSGPHPEHGYRRCLGVLNLARRYGKPRLEAACKRALMINSPTYRSVTSILKQGVDQQPATSAEETEPQQTLPLHDNVRGADYYKDTSAC